MSSGSGGPGGVVNFGDLDVTFSAPFYTGIFLSSRELQGDYEYSPETGTGDGSRERADLDKGEEYVCHQKIVIEGMEEKLPWGWSLPPYFEKPWQRTVSPPYFIKCSVAEDYDLNELSSKIEKVLSEIAEIELSDLRVESLEVKFYEFAFGSVSIRIEGLKLSINAIDLEKNFEKFLASCEKNVRKVLDCITKKATKAYRKSVPCCIKNSDIWDINNFGALEAIEGICDTGKVKEINTVISTNQRVAANFFNLTSKLKKVFVDFSEKLRKPPFNGSYHLFSTKERNATIAVSMIQNHDELEDIIDISEVLEVQLAVGRYFDNFFYSYYNYTSSQYEIVESKDHMYWKNLWGFKNLIEKFLDVQSMYFQTKDLASKDILILNCDEYILKLHSVFPKNTKIDNYFRKADQKINKIEKQYDKIKFIASRYLTFSVGFFTVAISSIFLSFSIALLINDNLLTAFAIASMIFIFSCLLIFRFVSLRLTSRKLYYICGLQKDDLLEQYKEQEKRNKSKGCCICEVKKCHRCRGKDWHSRIFYRDKNLCFRCGKKER